MLHQGMVRGKANKKGDMYENDNHKEDQWAEHGVISYKELIDGLLASSTNTKDLPEEEKQWITHSLHTNNSIPFFKAKNFVGSAQITPYQKIKQYLLEVQSRQNLVEHNEYQISKLDLEMERDLKECRKLEPESYEFRLLQLEVTEANNKLKQYKINLRQVQKERNSFLRLIREFNESPQGKYKDGRLLIDVLDDEKICEELEYEHWTYRMAKQTALDWIAYGRPGIGNMDAIFQMGGEQQEEVMSLAIELFTKNELRNKRLQAEVNKRLEEGAPSGKLVSQLELEMSNESENYEQERKKLENVRTIQARIAPTLTKHPSTGR